HISFYYSLALTFWHLTNAMRRWNLPSRGRTGERLTLSLSSCVPQPIGKIPPSVIFSHYPPTRNPLAIGLTAKKRWVTSLNILARLSHKYAMTSFITTLTQLREVPRTPYVQTTRTLPLYYKARLPHKTSMYFCVTTDRTGPRSSRSASDS